MNRSYLIGGSSNKPLLINLSVATGIKIASVEIDKFPNSEKRIFITTDVRDSTVFILQSTSSPVDEHLIEIALIADAAKRMNAKKIVAIIPWFGYSPQDKVFRNGEALSAEIAIKLLEASPIDEFVLIDIHSDSLLAKFSKRVQHFSAMPLFIDNFLNTELDGDWCVAALDKGSLPRTLIFAGKLDLPIVKFDKTRDMQTNEVTFHKLDGDVKNKNVISFDDFVSTGGTRIKAAKILKDMGANLYYDCVTHLIVNSTIDKLEESLIDRVFVTNTVNLPELRENSKVSILDVSSLLASFISQQY